MEWLNENRKTYIAVCFGMAVIYAFACGFTTSGCEQICALSIAIDAILFGILLFLCGILLTNLYRYAIPANYTAVYRNIFIIITSLLTGVLMLGIETIVIYTVFSSLQFDIFISSLPVRIVITGLIICIIRLLFIVTSKDNQSKIEALPYPAILPAADQTSASQAVIDRLTVRSGQKIKIIPFYDIQYIKADGDYISVRTSEGSWLKELTMNAAEDMLPKESFVRVHRSYIVNINSISRIERYGEQRLIILHNAEKIKISAARYQALRSILGL